MGISVITAVNEFMSKTVNLESSTSSKARSSRDWLLTQIAGFESNVDKFPKSYSIINKPFGSFARRTKIRELDDIDVMIGLTGEGSHYTECTDKITITVNNEESNLKKYCFDYTSELNSRKIINRFVSSCSNVEQYSSAEIKRNQEAATLKLKSYSWNFDIVPCFITAPDASNNTYYLIPDGNGYWKKTDPRIDQQRASEINQKHDGNVLQVIRIMKYWNKRNTKPIMSSYLVETIILNYYDLRESKASSYVDIEVPKVLYYLYSNIMSDINDPKGIQGNINHLSYDDRLKVRNRAYKDFEIATQARDYENQKKPKESIGKWRDVFGDSFPKYE